MLNESEERLVESDRRSFLKFSAASLLGVGLGTTGGAQRASAQELLGQIASGVESFNFCVVADSHCVEGAGGRYKEGIERLGNGVEKFLRCDRAMAQLEEADKPDFMLVVGDVHLWALRDHLHKVEVPMHVIAGNHEDASAKKEMRDLFPGDFKKEGKESDYYSFVHKGVRFIGVCNAGRGGDHIGHLCSEDFGPRGQCEWLEAELQKKEQQKIVFAHIPPHPEGGDENMYMGRNDSRYFNALIERTQPTAMFFGHLHQATTEHKIVRTQSFTLRSCCWNDGRATIGFMHVKVTPTEIVTRPIDTGVYEPQHSSNVGLLPSAS